MIAHQNWSDRTRTKNQEDNIGKNGHQRVEEHSADISHNKSQSFLYLQRSKKKDYKAQDSSTFPSLCDRESLYSGEKTKD